MYSARDLVERVGRRAVERRDARLECVDRRLLRAEDDVVDLALPRSEVAVDRQRARDVGRVHRILAADVEHDQVAALHHVLVLRVVEHASS